MRRGSTVICERSLFRLLTAAADSLLFRLPLRLLVLLPVLPLFPLLCRTLLPVDRLEELELPRLLTVPLPDELRLLLRFLTLPLLLRLLLLPRRCTEPLLLLRFPVDLFTLLPLLLVVDLLLTVLLVVPRDRTVPVLRRIFDRDDDRSI